MTRTAIPALALAAVLASAGCGDKSMATDYSQDGTTWEDSAPPPYDAGTDASPPDVAEEPEEVEPPPDDVCEADITEPQVLYLSADDSNSMASPIIARSLIRRGNLVPAAFVRTWEFTNYYDIGYEPPAHGRLNVQIHMKPAGEDLYNMQIGAQSHEVGHEEGRRLNLTLVLDTSGSMMGTPITLEKHACRAIASSLREGDIVSMVTWSVSNAVVLDSHVVSGPDDAVLLSRIESLSANGGTNLHGGLSAGYALAQANFDPAFMNRVILVSDGQANMGVTDEELIAEMSDDEEGEAIYLVGVGVGMGYNDTLMDAVTDAGKGAYVFIDTEAEAAKIFGERFQSTMEIAVMDVQVELTLPPWLRVDEYHGEEISTDPKEVEPQHLAPNDAMVFHQTLRSCEMPVMEEEIRAVARYTDPATRERMSDEALLPIGWLLEDVEAPQLVKGTAIVQYAEGLKDISDLVAGGEEAEARELCNEIRDALSDAADLTGDPELQDIAVLMGQYCGTLPSRTWPGWT